MTNTTKKFTLYTTPHSGGKQRFDPTVPTAPHQVTVDPLPLSPEGRQR